MANINLEEVVKRLELRVQFLEDKLIKQQRENADLLEQLTSLSDSGVSTALVGKLNKKFSEIVQTEDKISSTVADLSDETRKKYSKIEQTAEKIEMEVGAVYNEVLIGDDNPITNPEYYEKYKGSLVSWNGKNYRYSTLLNKWEQVDGNSISSSFKQTADGFFLDGDIKINGNTYQNGKIVSSSLYTTGDANDTTSSYRPPAVYICNGSEGNIAGVICYDSTGDEESEAASADRMIVAAEMGYALKIMTYCDSFGEIDAKNISIGAGLYRDGHTYSGDGFVYFNSPVVFGGDLGNGHNGSVRFNGGCKVDFTDATVTGLYAVFE